VGHIVVLPLYPQYSCSTVAAVWDELARILAKKRAIPGISFIRDYAGHPDYIHALAASVRARLPFMGNRICCCFPIMGSRSAMPTRG
jgi:ferrochelatase